RAGEAPRLAHLRGAARATADARPCSGARALQAAAGRLGDGERSVYAAAATPRSPLADPARPYFTRFQAVTSPKAVHYGHTAIRPYVWATLLFLAACTPSGEGVVALQGATLIDGSGGPPVTDALLLIKDGHVTAVARVNEVKVPS